MKLQEKYKKEIIPAMKKKFGYKNENQIPKILKVVINVGFGRHVKEKAFIDSIVNSLARITGQKPILSKAKKSISAFKLREGTTIGAVVTIRGKRMYDFIDRLVNITFPRVRDFRGLNPKIIDRNGNLTVGMKEHMAFPEIGADEMEQIHGLEISIPNTANTRDEGFELYKLLGFPFRKD